MAEAGTHIFYTHIYKEASLLKIGDFVKQGDMIGLMGESGNSTGLHLHFVVR